MTKPKILFIINQEELRLQLLHKLTVYFRQHGVSEKFEVIAPTPSSMEKEIIQEGNVAYLVLCYEKLNEHFQTLKNQFRRGEIPIERIVFVKEEDWISAWSYYVDDVVNHVIPVEWPFERLFQRFKQCCQFDEVSLTRFSVGPINLHLELKKTQQKFDELIFKNEVLLSQVSEDGLTGLSNRREFDRVMAREVSRSNRSKIPFSVIMCDVDFFKHYNDHFGHPAGDEVLKLIAELLRTKLRQSDIPARYGGEEFVVVLPNTEKIQAVQVANKLRRLIEEFEFPFEKGQPNGDLTMSMGVGAFGEDGFTAVSIIEAADKELYRAKQSGRNCVKSSLMP